ECRGVPCWTTPAQNDLRLVWRRDPRGVSGQLSLHQEKSPGRGRASAISSRWKRHSPPPIGRQRTPRQKHGLLALHQRRQRERPQLPAAQVDRRLIWDRRVRVQAALVKFLASLAGKRRQSSLLALTDLDTPRRRCTVLVLRWLPQELRRPKEGQSEV